MVGITVLVKIYDYVAGQGFFEGNLNPRIIKLGLHHFLPVDNFVIRRDAMLWPWQLKRAVDQFVYCIWM